MKKNILFILILIPMLLFSQEDKNKPVKDVKTVIPVQSQYSNNFAIKEIYFNKKVDIGGKGEILEVEFVLKNQIDDPQDLYIFVIATFEKKELTKSSFERPIPKKERLRSFVPYPDDIKNFQYPELDSKGDVVKDATGKEMIKLVKFPRDTKAGIDPSTGKPYHLNDKLIVRTEHLSVYRTNFFFFNEVAVLIFDNEGKVAYRQLFILDGYRR